MKSVRNRNHQVFLMRKVGISHREIALKFRVSTQRVQGILREIEAKASLFKRSHQLRQEIRQADDLHKTLAVVDLLDTLRLATVTRKALMNHFELSQTPGITLLDLMDLAISEQGDCTEGFSMTPLLRIRFVGKVGYWSVVNALTDLDLGDHCNQEWSRRLERLKRCWQIRGATPYSGSKPYEPPPEWLEEMTGEMET